MTSKNSASRVCDVRLYLRSRISSMKTIAPSLWSLWLQVPCCLCVASVWPFSTESCSDSSHAPITNWLQPVQIHHQPALQYPQAPCPLHLSVCLSPSRARRASSLFKKLLHLPLFLLTSLKPLLPPSTPSVSSISLRLLSRSLRRRSALSQNFALYSSLKGSSAVCWISICNMLAEGFLERLWHSARCES